jgi:UDP-N-acetylmuramyl pentapeptide synthase
MIVTVGSRSEVALESARRHGLSSDQALGFKTSAEAATALLEVVQKGDVVLIKGSQSIRMEKIVEALLADKKDAHLLVRQDAEWKRR